ncbi:MAG: hypothetical protein ABJC13_04885 [Acidobacteriota bacterium]
MKKATPRSTRFAPARLDAVAGGIHAQIIDLGNPAPPPSDIGAHIVDIG